MAGVWVATLERFGYTLMVAERTKQKATDALIKVYKQTYQKYNNFNSIEEMENDEEFKHYYELAMEELYVRKMEYGIVEWC